jgi:hypothetical protein
MLTLVIFATPFVDILSLSTSQCKFFYVFFFSPRLHINDMSAALFSAPSFEFLFFTGGKVFGQ